MTDTKNVVDSLHISADSAMDLMEQQEREITELKTLIEDIAACRLSSTETGSYAGWSVSSLSKLHHRISEVVHGLNAENLERVNPPQPPITAPASHYDAKTKPCGNLIKCKFCTSYDTCDHECREVDIGQQPVSTKLTGVTSCTNYASTACETCEDNPDNYPPVPVDCVIVHYPNETNDYVIVCAEGKSQLNSGRTETVLMTGITDADAAVRAAEFLLAAYGAEWPDAWPVPVQHCKRCHDALASPPSLFCDQCNAIPLSDLSKEPST